MIKYLLPALAALGLIMAVYVVRQGAKPVPTAQAAAQPAQAPFMDYVAGAGIVEASTENINIGTVVAGVVTEVYVKIGDDVKKGDKLFKLDTRDLEAELEVRRAAGKLAEAKVPEAEANLGEAKSQLDLYESVADARAITKDEMSKRRFAAASAAARLAEANADVISSRAMVQQTLTEIERRFMRAPVDGQILQVKIHPGEFALAGELQTPLMIMGGVNQLNIRTDIDENDAWRFRTDAPAIAYVRGNPKLNTPVRFVRVEPYVIPKKSLTGDTTERVDTRVLQILYGFKRGEIPVYVGQQMDVFIEAPRDGAGTRPAAVSAAGGPS